MFFTINIAISNDSMYEISSRNIRKNFKTNLTFRENKTKRGRERKRLETARRYKGEHKQENKRVREKES